MGYGEYGGGGSVQWRVTYNNPPQKRKDALTERVHYYGKDKTVAHGDTITVIVENVDRVVREPNGNVRLEMRLSNEPDQVQIYWGADAPPKESPKVDVLYARGV
jgi:hypothetical protein